MTEAARTISIRPAYHRCDKGKGICDPRMIWTLRVGSDAITWEVFTGWGMPDEAFRAESPDCDHAKHQDGWPYRSLGGRSPRGTPVGVLGGAIDYHFAEPTGTELGDGPCEVLDGHCYRDVSFLGGDELFDLLRVEGDEAVWAALDERLTSYRSEVDA